MIYLNEEDLKQLGFNWDETINTIEKAVNCLSQNDFAQPVKPYLRYKDLKNRIIAMPAFVGGNINMAGIKWIASFPDNIHKGIQRAHSVVILNNADTGKPECIINTALLSIIRTASVSGLMIKYYEKVRNLNNVNVGIIGWGPIGQHHYKMCKAILGNKISKVFIYDIKKIDQAAYNFLDDNVIITDNWEEAYNNADIFMTCTVSKASYINHSPKIGSLHLNVSLRDYAVDVYDFFKGSIIVDNWEEVCRENTDIENMHLKKGLNESETKTIIDVVMNNCLKNYKNEQSIMFNPMGMGVFDIAIANYYLKLAELKHSGQILN
jgi:N-[(2S)-2-amino-2-carboxyethyl]-L-glutamate dehydrogenase